MHNFSSFQPYCGSLRQVSVAMTRILLVSCPNCRGILPVDPINPVYRCGSCLSIIQVKKKLKRAEASRMLLAAHEVRKSVVYKLKHMSENYEEDEKNIELDHNIYPPAEEISIIKNPNEFPGQNILESYPNTDDEQEIVSYGIISQIWSNRTKKNEEVVYFRIKAKDDEIPANGFEWRESGEEIVALEPDPYPRFYFRLAAQGCRVIKNVERDEGDPSYLNITYRGSHICTSNTMWRPSSEYLERCLSYCLLFPPGHEFYSDSMVLMWIAEGVIDGESSERLEDKEFVCLQLLLCHGFIMLSGVQKGGDHLRYKVNIHKVFELYVNMGSFADEFLIIGKDVSSKLSRRPLHVSLAGERFDNRTLESLMTFQELRTLVFLGNLRYLVKQVPRVLFLSLNLLRTLDLSQTQVSEFPSSVGNLEDLRFLDLSGTLIRELPGVLCDLVELQTLKLRDCPEFSELPKGMMKLTKLRHLDLDIIHQLSDMPKGMGRLVNIQTLKGFIVGTVK